MTRQMRANEVRDRDLFQLPSGEWGEVLGVSARPAAVEGGTDEVRLTYRRLADPPGKGRTYLCPGEDTFMVSTEDDDVIAAEGERY